MMMVGLKVLANALRMPQCPNVARKPAGLGAVSFFVALWQTLLMAYTQNPTELQLFF